MSAAVISLLTDFGVTDPYVGVMKGVILGINPEAKLVDVTHDVPPQDVLAGALLLHSSYRHFPEGTVHLVVVDPGVGSERRLLAARTKRGAFVGPDNGVLTLALEDEEDVQVVEVGNRALFREPVSDTFHGRDILAPVAAHLSLGFPLQEVGPAALDLTLIEFPRPARGEGEARGEVIYVDHFGNAVTNLTTRDAGPGKLEVRVGERVIGGISRSYAARPPGELLAVVGSMGFIELAVNRGSAAAAFGLKCGDPVVLRKVS